MHFPIPKLRRFLQVALAISFVVLGYLINSGVLRTLDINTAIAARAISGVWADHATALIISFGSVEITGVVCLLMSGQLWRRGARLLSILVIAGLALSVGIEFFCKSTISQPKVWPEFQRKVFSLHILHLNTKFNFPSGHATRAIFTYGLLSMLPAATNRSRRKIALITLIVLVGIGLVYVGGHWISDVFGGYLLGGFILSFLTPLMKTSRGDNSL